MQLTTPVTLEPMPFSLNLGTSIYALGSCFAERVGERLARYLFPVTLNPYGILYNPLSLAPALAPNPPRESVLLHQGRWRSLHHHSQLAAETPQETRRLLRQAEERKVQALTESELLLLTLGTAQVFELQNNGRAVANCHRLPQQLFRRRRLCAQQCYEALAGPLTEWLDGNTKRQVVVTVSPVRYLRDGLVENSRGKASLLLACEELESNHPRLHYFPAYEILTDELRSYRFYQADMVHPTELAVDLIWERFRELVVHPGEAPAYQELERLHKARNHRFSPSSDQAPLAKKSLVRLEKLAASYPQLALSEYREYFESLL